jgi:hypothetical protein
MNEIQPIAAHVPYQVCPGNHEDKRYFGIIIKSKVKIKQFFIEISLTI